MQVLKGFFVSAPFWSTVGLAVKLLGLTHSSQPSLSSSRGEEGFKNMSLCVPHSKYGIKENKRSDLYFAKTQLGSFFIVVFLCARNFFFFFFFSSGKPGKKKPRITTTTLKTTALKKKKGTLVHLSKEI